MHLSNFFAVAALMALPMTGMSQLVISEVVEGTMLSFKYVEIVNRGATAVDLTSPAISLRRYMNGGSSPTSTNLTGTIGPGKFYVIANESADFTGFTVVPTVTSNNITHTGDDSYELYDGTNVIDSFAGDWIGGGDPGNPAADGAYFRVLNKLPNNGHWGGESSNPIADGTDSPSGYWTRVAMTPGNGNATTICTPLTSGGASSREVPVAMSAFSID